MANILILHGPNLNLLGLREPAIYGHTTLTSINDSLKAQAKKMNHAVTILQSNAEHVLVDRIHSELHHAGEFIIFNPAAFTHSSIALRDALVAVNIPFIEVHLSNIDRRDAFRQQSYFSDIAVGTISGFGADSYRLALDHAHYYLTTLNRKES
jgi:3-dehydroquinate dehydratase-2